MKNAWFAFKPPDCGFGGFSLPIFAAVPAAGRVSQVDLYG